MFFSSQLRKSHDNYPLSDFYTRQRWNIIFLQNANLSNLSKMRPLETWDVTAPTQSSIPRFPVLRHCCVARETSSSWSWRLSAIHSGRWCAVHRHPEMACVEKGPIEMAYPWKQTSFWMIIPNGIIIVNHYKSLYVPLIKKHLQNVKNIILKTLAFEGYWNNTGLVKQKFLEPREKGHWKKG